MLELLARHIPAASQEEAPAIWEQGWWDKASCLVLPGLLGSLEASVQLSWSARQAGIMGMTQPKRRLTSSTQRGGHSSGQWLPRLSPQASQAAGSAASGRPQARDAGPGAATAAGRTSCPPSSHPAPGVAALPPGSQGSAPQRARA